MNKKWILAPLAPEEFKKQFPEYHPLVLQLLYNRNIVEKEKIEAFLNPDYDRHLYDPFLMLGMKEAVKRIKKAIFDKEKIAVYGDYDVDGVAATVLLSLVLKSLGLEILPYIPSRKEGYGLKEKSLEELKKQKMDLIITADCGISNQKEIKKAQKLKMEVIVTDHHEIPKNWQKKKSQIVLNPKQPDCPYPFKQLSGSGVAFKLAQALSVESTFLKWLLDLVALGTICDLMPLLNENRILTKFGLIVLSKTKRIGLKKLYEIAQIDPNKIGVYEISFLVGPRLNAPGRMDHANTSFYLLSTEDERLATQLAKVLDTYNQKRQRALDEAYQQAKAQVEEKSLTSRKLILVADENWPQGLIGLIAQRLTEEYTRPSLVLQKREKYSRGSARSIEALHITELLSSCSEFLLRYGGHKKAAGFFLFTDKIGELENRLLGLAEEKLTEEDITPFLDIEAKIDLSEINWRLWEELLKFEPTGFGNPRPLFMAENVKIEDMRRVGSEGEHLKLILWGFEAIFFKKGELEKELSLGTIIDLVFQINVSEWKGEKRLELKILDLKVKE